MIKSLFIIFLTFFVFTKSAISQLIDPELYIKEKGAQQTKRAGKGIFYTSVILLPENELTPYFEYITTMPRTEIAKSVCHSSAEGYSKTLREKGYHDVSVNPLVVYGGPIKGVFACFYFAEKDGNTVGGKIDFIKLIHKPTAPYDLYTVSITAKK